MKVQIPQGILRKLDGIKDAKAILFTGSRAVGKATKNSDWDFFIVLKDGVPRWRKTTKFQDTWIELLSNDRQQVEKEFAEDLENGRGITTTMFVTGQVVKESPDKVLEQLVRKAKSNWSRRPKKLSTIKKVWISYDMSTYIQDVEDCLHDGNAAHLLFNHAVDEFVNYYYRLGSIWMPRPKDRMHDLKNRDKKVYGLVLEANSAQGWMQKAKTVIKLGKYVGKKYGLSLSGEAYIPSTRLAVKRA